MSGLEFGIGITQAFPPSELGALARLCEELGYSQIWYANHKLSRDLYMGLAWIAFHTKRIRIGTFIAEPYSYHPAMIAAAAGTLDELSDGRAILLLGAGAANFAKIGLQRKSPVIALRDTIQICRSLFRGQRVTYEGRMFHVKDAQLDFETRPDLPILVAARGQKMLELAGELCDGAMVATYATVNGLRDGLSHVERGSQHAHRAYSTLPIFTRVDLAISDEANVAREQVRPSIAQFLTASYPDRQFVQAVGLNVPDALENICRQHDDDLARRSGHLVPDSFIDAFTWAGNPWQVAEKIAAVVDSGIRKITFVPQPSRGSDVIRITRSFVGEVIPRIHALGIRP